MRTNKRKRKPRPTSKPQSSFLIAAGLVTEAMARLDKGLAASTSAQLGAAGRFLRITLESCANELGVLDAVAPILQVAARNLLEADVLWPRYAAAFGVKRTTRPAPGEPAKITAGGISFPVTCDVCGQPQSIMAPWSELAMIGDGYVPSGWSDLPRHGTLRADVPCFNCGNKDVLLMGPAEARRHVRSGIEAGYVPPAADRAARKKTKTGKRARRRSNRRPA